MYLYVSVACTFQLHVHVFGFEAGALCQPFFPTLFFLLTAELVYLGERMRKLVGENLMEQAGDPAYQLPAADWSQLMQGSHPKYDRLNICFGLVSLFW